MYKPNHQLYLTCCPLPSQTCCGFKTGCSPTGWPVPLGNLAQATNGLASAPLSSLYGERTQWNGQAFIKALRSQNAAVPTAIKDAILEWGNQGGEMQFRYITNPTLPTGFIRIHTLTSGGNAYYGSNQPGTLSGTPKLGISTAKQTGLTVQTVRAAAGEFLSEADEDFSSATGVIGFVKSGGFNTFNIGVQGIVEAGSANYGVWGQVPGTKDAFRGSGNYAVFGTCPQGFNSYAGFFQGDVFATGLYQGSDRKLKTNIATETNMLDLLQQLNPVTYQYNTSAFKGLNLSSDKQHGLIAQELQAVFPELVKASRYTNLDEKGSTSLSDEFLAVNYQGLIPIMLKAIQELKGKVDALETALSQKGNATAIEAEPGKTIATKAGNFKASQFTLLQNTPNPFSGTTTIRYALPEGVSNATIAVFDLNGKMQLQYGNLNGSSQITINGNTLQPGMYIYTLLAEGQEVVSKRMILTK
jgi:Chaperone of endosialidase/Secretion system C-terminal sorting domain